MAGKGRTDYEASFLKSAEPICPKGRKFQPGLSLAPLSVIIPTRNRANLLAGTLEICQRHSTGVTLEFAVVDRGSTDQTEDVLRKLSARIPNLSWKSVPGATGAEARVIGAESAKYDLVMFLDDDLAPCEDDFFCRHISLHSAFPEENAVVLGKELWSVRADRSFTLDLAAGEPAGGPGEIHLTGECLPDYRNFQVANFSIKKKTIAEWRGGSEETASTILDDAEIRFRMAQNPQGLKLLHDPAAVACHAQPHTLDELMSAQESAGESLARVIRLHPAAAQTLSLQGLLDTLSIRYFEGVTEVSADYDFAIEGIKSWVRAIMLSSPAGSEPWGQDLLAAVCELCRVQGFLSAWPDGANPAAKSWVVDHVIQRARQILHAHQAQLA